MRCQPNPAGSSFRAVPALAALLVLLTACPGADQRPHDILVVGVLSDLQSWNPYLTETRFSDDLLALVYPTLLEEMPDYHSHPPTFTASLAESWEVSDDRCEVIFHLDPRARWSDGVPVSADDVVFTWQVQTSPEVGWYGSYTKDFIESVETLDPLTVRFRFTHDYPYQLMDANEGLIVPSHIWSAIPFAGWETTDWLPLAVAGGPFRPISHRSQQEIVLAANPEYGLGDPPRIRRAVWRVVPDLASLMTQLEAGDLDFVGTVPPSYAERVRSHPGLTLVVHPDRGYTHICWNLRRPPLDDPRVRRALSLAIDTRAIVDTVYRGYANPSVGPILTSMWAFDGSLSPLPHDPGAARRLLVEAGWADRDGDGLVDREGEPLELELLVNSENRMRLDIAVLVARDLELVGIRVTPRTVEWGTFLSQLQSGDFDGAINRWIEPTQIDLEDVWRTPPPGTTTSNYGGYSNPAVDTLIDQAAETATFVDQKPLFDEIQRLVVADQPYTFLVEAHCLNAISRRVHGAVVNDATPYYNLDQWVLR